MRTTPPAKLEEARIQKGPYGDSTIGDMFGAFTLNGPRGHALFILSSGVDTDAGWEHVSISTRNRPPHWNEMQFVKELFWGDDELVVQYHPARKDYVNLHPHCLHLWRPIDGVMPAPPSHLVGPKTE